jgi:hypothetical protein
MPLPAEFAELETHSDWILATEPQRYAKRLSSTMEEMQAFYDATFPRMEEALTYLDPYPLHELPDEARDLLYLLQSLVTVSFSVEVWGQPHVPDSGHARLDMFVEPVVY